MQQLGSSTSGSFLLHHLNSECGSETSAQPQTSKAGALKEVSVARAAISSSSSPCTSANFSSCSGKRTNRITGERRSFSDLCGVTFDPGSQREMCVAQPQKTLSCFGQTLGDCSASVSSADDQLLEASWTFSHDFSQKGHFIVENPKIFRRCRGSGPFCFLSGMMVEHVVVSGFSLPIGPG